MDAAAEPAADLQEAFERLPPANADGWLGADSDVSVVVRPGEAGVKRQLWIFADTFVGKYDPSTASRVWPHGGMPRNSVGLAPCGADGSCRGKPEFFCRRDGGGLARAFFDIEDPLEILWPVAALASRDGSEVLIMAQRIRGGLNVVGTTAVSLSVGSGDDPSTWTYVTHPASGAELTWFSGLSYERPEDPADDSLVLFGHANDTDKEATTLARGRFSLLFAGAWGSLEYWSGGAWASTAAALRAVRLPTWESAPMWSGSLGRFYTFDLRQDARGAAIDLWAAEAMTGPWRRTEAIYRLPAPFNGTAVPGGAEPQWLCYAAKAHPEMASSTPSTPGAAELPLSYVCNAWGDLDTMKDQLYRPGAMAMRLRDYWPKFLRVSARLSASGVIAV